MLTPAAVKLRANTGEDFSVMLRDALAECCSRFHQLMLLAALRHPLTALWTVPGRAEPLPFEAGEIIRRYREIALLEWLSLSLTEQHAEVAAYLDTLEPEARRVLLYLLRSRHGQEWLGQLGGAPEEQELLKSDLRMVAELLSRTGG